MVWLYLVGALVIINIALYWVKEYHGKNWRFSKGDNEFLIDVVILSRSNRDIDFYFELHPLRGCMITVGLWALYFAFIWDRCK